MNKYHLIIFLFFWSICPIYAQSKLKFIVNNEGKLFAIPSDINYEIKIPETKYKCYTSVSEQNRRLLENYTEFYKQYTSLLNTEYIFTTDFYLQEADRPINMNTLSKAYRPFFNPYIPMLWNVSPMALDYNETFRKTINKNTALWINGIQETWPALGGTNIINTAISYQVGNFSITTGGFAGRYYTPYTSSPTLWGGINILAHYDINEWLAVNAWGSQSFYGKNRADPFLQMNPLLNRTNIGGSMNFKVNDNFKFGVGINFQHNRMNQDFGHFN